MYPFPGFLAWDSQREGAKATCPGEDEPISQQAKPGTISLQRLWLGPQRARPAAAAAGPLRLAAGAPRRSQEAGVRGASERGRGKRAVLTSCFAPSRAMLFGGVALAGVATRSTSWYFRSGCCGCPD